MSNLDPKAFLEEIEWYINTYEIDLETVNHNNIEYENYEQLLCGNDIFDFRYGATRGCFIPEYQDKLSFVFKFDFNELEEEYCKRECEIYNDAIEAGLEDCFTKIKRFGSIFSVPIYKCEYAEIAALDCKISKQTENMINKHTSKHDHAPDMHLPWVADFINYYGFEVYDKFLDFIIEHGINDLHWNNVGYAEGRPVLTDYAGYFEENYATEI